MTALSQIYDDVPCTFCGCLCDDIRIVVEDNIIVKCDNGCAISKTRFLGHKDNRIQFPQIRSNKTLVQASLEDAINRAAEIIISARRLLVYGLSSTENDAHREAYMIAEDVGGIADNTSSVCHGPSIIGSQESGEPTGSLAEVKHRADLVIYWGANPMFAHPRHIRRYVRAQGEYVDDPKKDRKIWIVDIRKSASAGAADRFIKIEPGKDLEVLSTIRALVRGHAVDVKQVGGLTIEELEEIATTFKQAKYGVLFFGLGLTQSKGRHRNVDAAIRLVQDLNSFTKWQMMPMRGHYNVTGANKTSTWQTGYPFSVDYSRGYPRYQPGEYSAVDLLFRRDVDAVLNIAADPAAHLPKDTVAFLSTIPVINLDPKMNMTSLIAEVNIPAAIAGIECDGAAVRMDGLPLYLKKVIDPPEGVLPDREVLHLIRAAVEKGVQ